MRHRMSGIRKVGSCLLSRDSVTSRACSRYPHGRATKYWRPPSGIAWSMSKICQRWICAVDISRDIVCPIPRLPSSLGHFPRHTLNVLVLVNNSPNSQFPPLQTSPSCPDPPRTAHGQKFVSPAISSSSHRATLSTSAQATTIE